MLDLVAYLESIGFAECVEALTFGFTVLGVFLIVLMAVAVMIVFPLFLNALSSKEEEKKSDCNDCFQNTCPYFIRSRKK